MKRVKGQGLVEYAIILVLIAIVVIGTLTIIGGNTTEPCQEGYFYSTREYACIPGYRP